MTAEHEHRRETRETIEKNDDFHKAVTSSVKQLLHFPARRVRRKSSLTLPGAPGSADMFRLVLSVKGSAG